MHFAKIADGYPKMTGKELDMIPSGGVFFVAARPSESTSREANTLELNPMKAAEVEQAALAREHTAFGTPGPAAGATLDPRCASVFPRDPQRPQVKRERCARRRDTLSKLVSMVHCGASCGQAAFEGGSNQKIDEAVPRIDFDFADFGREEDQVLPIPSLNAVDVGSESLSATLVPRKQSVSIWWKRFWHSLKHLDTMW